jgi:hypothetical protein
VYWHLREENLKEKVESLGDMYDQMRLTDAQKEGEMRQHQYSSIMDYGNSWANDIQGLGKYDAAAIMFGYTVGRLRGQGRALRPLPQPEGRPRGRTSASRSSPGSSRSSRSPRASSSPPGRTSSTPATS